MANQLSSSRFTQYRLFLIYASFSVFIITLLYHHNSHNISSGFTYRRLGVLQYNFQTGGLITESYNNFILVPYLLTAIKVLTGLEFVEVLYIPLIPIGILLGYYSLSRFFLGNRVVATIPPLLIFFYHAGNYPHLTEYATGKFVFLPIFLLCLLKYLSDDLSAKRRWAIVLFILFIAIRNYSSPITLALVVIVTFLTSVDVLANIKFFYSRIFQSVRLTRTPSQYSPHLLIILLFILITFIYNNQKITQYLLTHDVLLSRAFRNFYNFLLSIIGISSETASFGDYHYRVRSPPLLTLTNTIFIAALFFSIAGAYIYNTIQDSMLYAIRDWRMLLITAVGVQLLAETIYWGGTSYGIALRLPLVLFPIFSIYLVTQTDMTAGALLIAILIISSGLSFITIITNDTIRSRPAGDPAANMEMAGWQAEYQSQSQPIIIDHHSYGILSYNYGSLRNNPHRLTYAGFNSSTYHYMLGENSSFIKDGEIIINMQTKRFPQRKAPPSYGYVEPLDNKIQYMGDNNNISKIYTSDNWVIYEDHNDSE